MTTIAAFDDKLVPSIAVLGTMTLIHAIFLFVFYAPAHGGTDQNGYHVKAKLLGPIGVGNMPNKGEGAAPRSPNPVTWTLYEIEPKRP